MWIFTAPDGSTVQVEIADSKTTRLQLLDFWYRAKIAPFKTMRDKARYEISTGEKFNE